MSANKSPNKKLIFFIANAIVVTMAVFLACKKTDGNGITVGYANQNGTGNHSTTTSTTSSPTTATSTTTTGSTTSGGTTGVPASSCNFTFGGTKYEGICAHKDSTISKDNYVCASVYLSATGSYVCKLTFSNPWHEAPAVNLYGVVTKTTLDSNECRVEVQDSNSATWQAIGGQVIVTSTNGSNKYSFSGTHCEKSCR